MDRTVNLQNQFIGREEWATSPMNPFKAPFNEIPPYAYFNVLIGGINPLKTTDAWLDPANAKYDVSLHQWLNQMGQSDAAIELAYNTNPTHGNSAHDVSALMVMFAGAFGGMQRKLTENNPVKGYTAKNGNQSIPEAMANAQKSLMPWMRCTLQTDTIVQPQAHAWPMPKTKRKALHPATTPGITSSASHSRTTKLPFSTTTAWLRT